MLLMRQLPHISSCCVSCRPITSLIVVSRLRQIGSHCPSFMTFCKRRRFSSRTTNPTGSVNQGQHIGSYQPGADALFGVRRLSQLDAGGGGKREHFCSTAQALFKNGEERCALREATLNPYHHFQPVVPGGEDGEPSQRVAEFLEVSSMIADYGTPETVDQMSGAIYMHATITEDKCSQCLRLAETSIPCYSLDDVTTCLKSMTWWPSDTCRSLVVRELVRSLDKVCLDRLHSLHFTPQAQMRICYLWQSVLCQPSVRFTATALDAMREYVLQQSLQVVVSYLLLLSTQEASISSKVGSGAEFSSKITPHIEDLTETELMAAYIGLARLEACPGRDLIRSFLERRYGYRLA